ncbi:MAG: hypothetical protein AAFY29_17255 [Pseudomonadota bacterium]
MHLRAIAVVVCLMAMTACSTSGVRSLENETTATLENKIEVGQTSKETVLDIMGAPTSTSFTDSGLEVISYEFEDTTPGLRNFIPYNILSQVADGKRKQLTVLFDEQDIVKRFVLNEAKVQQRWGLLE